MLDLDQRGAYVARKVIVETETCGMDARKLQLIITRIADNVRSTCNIETPFLIVFL